MTLPNLATLIGCFGGMGDAAECAFSGDKELEYSQNLGKALTMGYYSQGGP